MPVPVTYAVVNSTFSYFVKLLPNPSSQYATAMDIVMAIATMMMVAMTGLTAFKFPLKDFFILGILNFIFKNSPFHKLLFSSKRCSS
jgi:hypothetical protein